MASTVFSDSLGTPIVASWLNDVNALTYGAVDGTDALKGVSLLGYKTGLTGGVGTTQAKYNRRIVSVEDFGAIGDGSMSTTAMYNALAAAWTSALASAHDLYFPPGTYTIGENNMPFRNPSNTPLLDCKNITLFGMGPSTILKTVSVAGADVLQLNALKNIHIRDMQIQATVSGSASGSNGISVTNGWDNITVDRVLVTNLGSLDKTTFVDGGKALTIQPAFTTNECGTLRARYIAIGCAEGFGYEPDLVTSLTKKTSIDIDVIAENCFYGVKYSSAAATGALSVNMTSGLRVKGQAINCQRSVVLSRAHGMFLDMQVISTKTAATKRLNPAGVTWFAAQTTVDALLMQYVKNGTIRVTGNVGACDYKAQIGGAAAGSSGLSGGTDFCNIDLDLVGTPASADLFSINSGGNSLKNSVLTMSQSTASVVPSDWSAMGQNNRIQLGPIYTGSFTATLVGTTTTPTGTGKYSINGDVVTLELPDITGTSNAASAAITGLPAEIQPLSSKNVLLVTTNNGLDFVSRGDITNGTLTLYNGTVFTFTTSGTKGVKQSTVTYRRS